MAEKFAFDYVNEILGIVNYVREVLRPAYTTGTAGRISIASSRAAA